MRLSLAEEQLLGLRKLCRSMVRYWTSVEWKESDRNVSLKGEVQTLGNTEDSLNFQCKLHTYTSPSFLGVLFANGEHWMDPEQFSLVTMRDFVMGKQSVEERMKEEAQCLVDKLMNAQPKTERHTLKGRKTQAHTCTHTHARARAHTHTHTCMHTRMHAHACT